MYINYTYSNLILKSITFQKESNLQQHQKFLDYVEFQKLAESDQRKKDKDNLKLLHQNYYDTFVNKKKVNLFNNINQIARRNKKTRRY